MGIRGIDDLACLDRELSARNERCDGAVIPDFAHRKILNAAGWKKLLPHDQVEVAVTSDPAASS